MSVPAESACIAAEQLIRAEPEHRLDRGGDPGQHTVDRLEHHIGGVLDQQAIQRPLRANASSARTSPEMSRRDTTRPIQLPWRSRMACPAAEIQV
ncbi:MAG: hypothetical protein U0R23_05905 [Candidatus Nanopelagicales bacterium]